MLYSGGWGQEETINHLLLECDFYGNLWHIVLRWLGIYIVQFGDISAHMFQFDGTHVFKKGICACIQAIWLAYILLIWKERNARIFNKQISLEQLFERVKLHSWWWAEIQKPAQFVDFHSWWTNTSLLLALTLCNGGFVIFSVLFWNLLLYIRYFLFEAHLCLKRLLVCLVPRLNLVSHIPKHFLPWFTKPKYSSF